MADPKDAVTQRLAALTPGQRAALKQRLSPVALSGHQIIAQVLKAEGITHVYSIAGTPIDKTLKACAQAGVQVVGVRHQGHGVLMALAQNYCDRISRHDNFFELGGHSLIATQVVSRVGKAQPIMPTLRSLFEHPTLADWAQVIDLLGRAGRLSAPVVPSDDAEGWEHFEL
jgi:aryl carrier-like protein